MHPPLLTEIKALTNGGLRLSWITSNDWGNVHVYSSTNLQLTRPSGRIAAFRFRRG